MHRRPDRGRRAARPRRGLHAPLQDAGRAQGRLRGARLEEDRRLPDPQPDPPRPRVPDQGGAGDLRRALHPPADRQDQGRRHPRRRADALLRGADGELLPERPGGARREAGEDALRRPARGGPARDRPPQLRRDPLHRRPRPRRRRRLLRHLRRAEDLRRDRHRRARDRAADVRAHLLVQASARGWPPARPAPTTTRRTSSSPGPRSARCSATAKGRRTSSRATRSPTS